jgi:SAM-dependent methyltransferase
MTQSLRFVVVRSPRLEFKGAADTVEQFILRRLRHAGIANVRFADSLDAALEDVRTTGGHGYVAIADVLNPMIDIELVRAMVAALATTGGAKCVSDGAVPGTQVQMVLDARRAGRSDDARVIVKRWDSQERHNNQFNLYKYKRLKMFLRLLPRVDRMHELSIDEFVQALEDDKTFLTLAAYGEDARMEWHDACPHCSGRIAPLSMRMSQPFCGFLPVTRPLYHECESCGLIVASPAVHPDDTHLLYDEFDKQDFVKSTNNPYDGSSPRCDFSSIIGDLPARASIIDLGGGIGNFSVHMKEKHPSWSVTHSDYAIKRNEHLLGRGILTRALDLAEDEIGREQYDLITAWEVIEHVPYGRLASFLRNVHDALRPGGYFVFSTPDFDSPLCRSFDFFAVCPPFHYLVFGQEWLRRYFEVQPQWQYCAPRYCSDFLDDAVNWAGYGSVTCPSLQTRATASVLGAIFGRDDDRTIRRALVAARIGTEVIVTLRKQQ